MSKVRTNPMIAAGNAKYMDVTKLFHAKYPDPITINNNKNVLLTVPLIVITSDSSVAMLNAFEVKTGFPDLYDK
tara:strand:- start:279 stop:500 length:222 start_codon:yes stop_codon:yes gene_type:complete